jgi:hypothetical protein
VNQLDKPKAKRMSDCEPEGLRFGEDREVRFGDLEAGPTSMPKNDQYNRTIRNA